MTIQEAQSELRRVYLGGSVGSAVCAVLWLGAAALGTWGTRRSAILALVVGGMFIFPATLLVLAAMRRSTKLSPGNTLDQLATQIAFTVPFSLPLVAAAASHHVNWFFPAMMLVVGVHYLPFIFLYGMKTYGVLAALMIGGSLAVAHLPGAHFALAGWATGALFVVFAFVLRAGAGADARRPA